MSINHASSFTAIGAGLAKTACTVIALGYVYPHVATTIAHAAAFVSHLLSGTHPAP